MTSSSSTTTDTTATTTSPLAMLRAALAINNQGCSMLENGHFGAAQKTFSEALGLLKGAVKKTNTATTACPSMINVEETLQTVASRLVRAQKRPVFTVFDICTLDDGEHHDLTTIKSSLKYGPSSTLVSPIRIRCSQACPKQEMMHRPMAIILYNQALSHLLWGQCAVRSKTCSASQQKHLRAAFLCLNMAQALLAKHLSCTTQDSYEQQRSMIVQVFVVNNLVQVLSLCGGGGAQFLQQHSASSAATAQRHTGQRQTLEEWIQLRNNLLLKCESLEEHEVISSHQGAAAAAA